MNHLPLHRLDHGVQLSDEERAHLESCDRCRVEARMLREVDETMRQQTEALSMMEQTVQGFPLESAMDTAGRCRTSLLIHR